MNAPPGRILCVDDDPAVQALIRRLLEPRGFALSFAGSAEEARNLLAESDFPLVLLDIGLPEESGLDLLRALAGRTPDVATVMVTGRDDTEVADAALEAGAYGYLTKPFSATALQIEVSNALHRRSLELDRRTYERDLEHTVALRTVELRHAYEEMVFRLGRAIEIRDAETGAHVERVGAAAEALALELGVEQARAELLRLASPLHDIGKIAVRESILLKPGPLTTDERAEMQRHTEVGRDLLSGSGNDLLELAATIAWTHHERWNGSGYPLGLAGDTIPIEGRIVAVADVADALASDRPYRPALPEEQVRDWIVRQRDREFDPRVVDAFLRILGSLGNSR
ncbi:MAG TPA: HD domain-containing phosphohydrolase [Gaiellaceae bacterium]|nr:HD domain-containing phosphohydrolase [Gaiellaceae bacterium]